MEPTRKPQKHVKFVVELPAERVKAFLAAISPEAVLNVPKNYRQAAGFCYYCGEKQPPGRGGKARCPGCLRKLNLRNKALREAARKSGKCLLCHQPREEDRQEVLLCKKCGVLAEKAKKK